MNKIFVRVLLCIALTITACRPDNRPAEKHNEVHNTTSIEGVLEGGAFRDVVLEEMAVREYIPIDTVTCDEEGRFLIDFDAEQTAFYVFRTGGAGYITLLIEPGQKIIIKGSYGQSERYYISGSEDSEALMELSTAHKSTLNELGEIINIGREASDLDDFPDIKIGLDQKFDSICNSFQRYSWDFIQKNHKSLATLIALYNLYGQGLPVFDPIEDFQAYLFVDSLLQVHYPEFEAALLLHTQVLEASSTKQNNGEDHRPDVGEIAPDFVSSRPDGSRLALSDLKGDYIMLSFWAGWSSLSREENPYLKEIWESKGNFPFKILQVSFDGELAEWTRAIVEEGLGWDHVCDLRRWESVIADLYGVEKIPSNYIIDPEGKIIARDLFGNELIKKYNEIKNY